MDDTNSTNVGDDGHIKFETPPISRIQLGQYPFTKRKFSFPASLNANLLGLSNKEKNGKDIKNTKRRFSNVGDVVSRKLSYTIGWKSQDSSPPQDVILQGRMLCGQYIKSRLKRSGIFSKKVCFYRLRSVIGTPSGTVVKEVTPFLMAAGVELERMHPKLYTSISRKASGSPGGVLVSDKTAAGLFAAIAHDLLKYDITWGKVVSLFAVAGGLAVDCVCQGHPEYLHSLLESMTEVLEDNLAEWVVSNGGWTALCSQCKCPETDLPLIEYASKAILVLIVLVIIYFIIRVFQKLACF
ncbi:hypothetical protein RI129_005131 [Pyrocoelia pectoralis]|uniref:Bcl-2 Bcl-2 homology region 1-3 domain-containing protein n=1 Tax=Pyrocoelia pectoralis TaxID=417401 RepID=A0AAN7ZK12_9COLE